MTRTEAVNRLTIYALNDIENIPLEVKDAIGIMVQECTRLNRIDRMVDEIKKELNTEEIYT